MESKDNNITNEYISMMNDNRKSRSDIYENIRICYKKLSKRSDSIKSIIQYTAIYLIFMGINAGISIAELNTIAPIIYGALTVGYGFVTFADVSFLVKNKSDDIYKAITEYNTKLSELDNKYIEYSNKLSKQNYNAQDKLVLSDNDVFEISKCTGDLFFSETNIDDEVANCELEEKNDKVKKYCKK